MSLRIAAIEPYAARSHEAFLDGWSEHSAHTIERFALPPRAWKWRMRTAAVHFARELAARDPFDAYLVSDYLDLPLFLALLPSEHARRPALVYFHENQLTYPLQPGEARDNHYALTHFHSLLVARGSLFNSRYHLEGFFEALGELLEHEPDIELASELGAARELSEVFPLGTSLPRGEPRSTRGGSPVVLWNHRWEYDKDPESFVRGLIRLARRGVDFRVVALGERFREVPGAHLELLETLGERVISSGFEPDRERYLERLESAHIAVSTARHEFFGLGTLEALRTGLHPVLPDDLAYPELLPDDLSERSRFLYPREAGLEETLSRALAAVSTGAALADRRRLVAATDRFDWTELGPRLDARLEALVDLQGPTPAEIARSLSDRTTR